MNADLVTLSACETGLGEKSGGEGYKGFSQPLFLAGARSLLLSMWKVDDDATALLMVRFYQNLLGKGDGLTGPMPKALALEEAKRWLRTLSVEKANDALWQLRGEGRGEPVHRERATDEHHLYAHPYYWAGFILVGDPGDLSEPPAPAPAVATVSPTPWWWYALLVAGLAAPAAWVVRWRVRRRSPALP